MDISIFPKNLQDQAIILSGEAAWSKEAAQEVIKFLSANNYAVLGVEIWLAEENLPKVVGWSHYDFELSNTWKEYVNQNANSALDILNKEFDDNSLFNLTWISKKDYDESLNSKRT